MKVRNLAIVPLLLYTNLVYGQTSGNIRTLRVNVDAFGNLVAVGSTQTSPITTTLLENARLRVDASGNLMVVITGGPTSSPILFPDGTAGNPAIAFNSDPSTGFRHSGSTATGTMFFDSIGSDVFAFGGTGVGVTLNAVSLLQWGSAGVGSPDTSLGRIAAGKIQLAGTTPMILFGGATSSFPALKQSTAQLQVRLADDSNYGPFVASTLQAVGTFIIGNNITLSAIAPTISSGFGTSPSVTTTAGSALFTVNVGTGGAASSGVIGLPTAANGWGCTVNMEGVIPTTLTKQSANSTTTVTVTNYTVATGATAAWTASTILTIKCMAR
jgi:hypothetical protein